MPCSGICIPPSSQVAPAGRRARITPTIIPRDSPTGEPGPASPGRPLRFPHRFQHDPLARVLVARYLSMAAMIRSVFARTSSSWLPVPSSPAAARRRPRSGRPLSGGRTSVSRGRRSAAPARVAPTGMRVSAPKNGSIMPLFCMSRSQRSGTTPPSSQPADRLPHGRQAERAKHLALAGAQLVHEVVEALRLQRLRERERRDAESDRRLQNDLRVAVVSADDDDAPLASRRRLATRRGRRRQSDPLLDRSGSCRGGACERGRRSSGSALRMTRLEAALTSAPARRGP